MPTTIGHPLFTLSNSQQSFSYVGDHACTQYSKWGVTYAQYTLKCTISFPLLYWTFRFIAPNILSAFFLAAITCAESLLLT